MKDLEVKIFQSTVTFSNTSNQKKKNRSLAFAKKNGKLKQNLNKSFNNLSFISIKFQKKEKDVH